jgi:hypothetical protein
MYSNYLITHRSTNCMLRKIGSAIFKELDFDLKTRAFQKEFSFIQQIKFI